jgi:hypothetical protein
MNLSTTLPPVVGILAPHLVKLMLCLGFTIKERPGRTNV